MPNTWNPDTYTTDFSFVFQYGSDVAKLVDVKPGSSVLDLGCGNGVLAHDFSNRGMYVIGIDRSPEFVATARKNYPDLTFIEADATNFSLEEPVDAVFSNAVLHWIARENHPKLLSCVHKALKPGGQFVFECGGFGNNAKIHAALKCAFANHGFEYHFPFYFPTIGEYAALLERAGFLPTYAILFDRPTPLKGNDGMGNWIRMFIKKPFDVVTNDKEKNAIITEAVDILRADLYHDGSWVADYVRLRMKAYGQYPPVHKGIIQ